MALNGSMKTWGRFGSTVLVSKGKKGKGRWLMWYQRKGRLANCESDGHVPSSSQDRVTDAKIALPPRPIEARR